jgi:hypothetical protein
MTKNPTLTVAHWVRTRSRAPEHVQQAAMESVERDNKQRIRIAFLEEQLKAAKRAVLYPMTDLA